MYSGSIMNMFCDQCARANPPSFFLPWASVLVPWSHIIGVYSVSFVRMF